MTDIATVIEGAAVAAGAALTIWSRVDSSRARKAAEGGAAQEKLRAINAQVEKNQELARVLETQITALEGRVLDLRGDLCALQARLTQYSQETSKTVMRLVEQTNRLIGRLSPPP